MRARDFYTQKRIISDYTQVRISILLVQHEWQPREFG
jgi:hypothetical protein